MLAERREFKRDKLLQYAERVWQIDAGTADERIDAAIQQTRHFFASLGVKTRLSDYQINADNIPAILKGLESHGMVQLGEQGQVSLEISRKVLLAAI